jgi:hypothetical protein
MVDARIGEPLQVIMCHCVRARGRMLRNAFDSSSSAIESSLNRRWSRVVPLPQDQLAALYERFMSQCIDDDRRRKFLSELEKRVRRSTFKPHALAEKGDSFRGIFGDNLPDAIVVKVAWGSPESGCGFEISGTTSAPAKIFVDEGDAVAEVCARGAVKGYFFQDGGSGEVLYFAGDRASQTQESRRSDP